MNWFCASDSQVVDSSQALLPDHADRQKLPEADLSAILKS